MNEKSNTAGAIAGMPIVNLLTLLLLSSQESQLFAAWFAMVSVPIVVPWFLFWHLNVGDWQPFACIMEPNGSEYESILYKDRVGRFICLFRMVKYIAGVTGWECHD